MKFSTKIHSSTHPHIYLFTHTPIYTFTFTLLQNLKSIIQNPQSAILNLLQHKGFKKYFANTSWLFVEKILRMGVGLFVGIWVARYLGPAKFGLLSYAQSFVGLFSPLRKIDFDGIVVKGVLKIIILR